jgi:Zn-dependent protease with chaperone function
MGAQGWLSGRLSVVPLVALLLAAPLAAAPAAAKDGDRGEVKLEGYAEWRDGDTLVVDGQRVRAASAKLKLEGARDWASIPLGYEMKVRGFRQPDGTVRAAEVQAKPNGSALFEGEVKSATDEAEAKYRRAGNFFEETDHGRMKVIGRLYDRGPRVDRVREIVDRLVPPYLAPDGVRVYVIENPEWNAFAMGNFSVYVFSGLLKDMDDDELALVLGHEIAHATHEHTRKHFKKEMWIQVAALGVIASAESIDDKHKRAVVQLIAQLGALAWSSGYGRSLEDQADRVGMRYAYEAGYDIRKGPELWERFARKYGQGNKVANFFFSDHSQSKVRAANLQRELVANYTDGPKPGRPVMVRHSTPVPANGKVLALDEGPAFALAEPGAGVPVAAFVEKGVSSQRIKAGMTEKEVRDVLGAPDEEIAFGAATRWTYPDLTVVFEGGRVKEVRF